MSLKASYCSASHIDSFPLYTTLYKYNNNKHTHMNVFTDKILCSCLFLFLTTRCRAIYEHQRHKKQTVAMLVSRTLERHL